MERSTPAERKVTEHTHIPTPLRPFRFVKIPRGSKAPFEDNWQDSNNYAADDPELAEHLEKGGNYGILGGYGFLLIIDADCPDVADALRQSLPETLTWWRGNEQRETFAFICENWSSSTRLPKVKHSGHDHHTDEGNPTNIGELIWHGKQAAGPGSVHPSGSQYRVKNEAEIAEVSATDVRATLSEWLDDKDEQQAGRTFEVRSNGHSTTNSGDVSPTVYEHLPRGDYPEEERVSHPFHGSSTGENFKVDEGGETFVCWRHGATGNVWHLVGMNCGIINCGEWCNGSLSSDTWHEIFKEAERRNIPTPGEDHRKNGAATSSEKTEQDQDKATENPIAAHLPDGVESISDAKQRELAYAASEHLRNVEKIKAVRTSEEAELFKYSSGIWTPGGKQKTSELVKPHVGPNFSRRLVNETAHHLRATNPVDRDDMGLPPGKVAVENGVLNLETCELEDHDPGHKALWKMPTAFDIDAECEPFVKYLREVVQDEQQEDVIKTIFEFIGYALQPRTHHKKALMIFGPTDSGKSVLFKVIQALFGEENDAAQSLQYLANERWGTSYLYGKPINTRADLGPGAIKDLGLIKEITAGDRITAERKGRPLFQFTPTTKMMFSANQAPQRDTEDEAFWNRWITIKFPEQIPKDEQDRELVDKLTQPDVLSGVLAEAVRGWHRVQEQDGFSFAPGPWKTKDKWMQYGDTLQQFINDAVEITGDPDDYVPKDKLYSAYTEYARNAADKVETKNKLTRELHKAGADSRERTVNGNRVYVYLNVTLTLDEVDGGLL